MPVYTLDVPAASPFIQYEGNWTFTASQAMFSDPSASTSVFVKVNFSGSATALIGTSSPSLIQLAPTVLLDYRVIQPQLDLEPQLDTSLMVQAQARFLGSETHSVKYNVTGAKKYTIQYVAITTGDANPYTTSQEVTIQNTDLGNITYAGDLVHHSNKTSLTKIGHNAHANISFYGNDIAVYGAIMAGEPLPSYSISLDGQPSARWPARVNVTENISQVLLYQTSNLTMDSHLLRITTHGSDNQSSLYLDRADVRRYNNQILTKLSNVTNTPAPRPVSPVPLPVPAAVIAGGVVGSIVFVMVTITCVFFFLRRRFRRARLILAEGDGLDGGLRPFRSEEDMPPPNYQHVFPQVGVIWLSRIERAWPRFPTAKTRANNAARPTRPGHTPPYILTPTPAMGDEQAEVNHVVQRNANDASILAWKGRQPEAEVVGKKSADDVILGRLELQEEACRA